MDDERLGELLRRLPSPPEHVVEAVKRYPDSSCRMWTTSRCRTCRRSIPTRGCRGRSEIPQPDFPDLDLPDDDHSSMVIRHGHRHRRSRRGRKVHRRARRRASGSASRTWTPGRCTAASGWPPRDERRARRRGRRARSSIELGERVLLDGRDVTEAIRTAEASEAASQRRRRPRRARRARAQAAGDRGRRRLGRRGPRHRHRRRARRRGQGLPARRPRASARAAARADLGRDVEEVLDAPARARRARPHRRPLDARGPRRTPTPVDTTGLTLDEVVDQVVTLAVEAKEIDA